MPWSPAAAAASGGRSCWRLAGRGWPVVFSYQTNAAAAAGNLATAATAGRTGAARAGRPGHAAQDRERLVQEALARFGRIDLLVNNAGMAPRQRVDLLEMSEASYDEVMATNLKGPSS